MFVYRMTLDPNCWYNFLHENGIWSCQNFLSLYRVAKRTLNYSQSSKRYVSYKLKSVHNIEKIYQVTFVMVSGYEMGECSAEQQWIMLGVQNMRVYNALNAEISIVQHFVTAIKMMINNGRIRNPSFVTMTDRKKKR